MSEWGREHVRWQLLKAYIQTDAQPTSVTGTSLSWSYEANTGRVKLYGTLSANTSEDITISF